MDTTSFLWVFVLLFLMATVSSLEEKVTGTTGLDVILPCFSDDPLGASAILWRTDNDRNVYDILDGKPNWSSQHPQFRNRTSSFPEEYGKGNFSIKLNDVSVSDIGLYRCSMPMVGFHHQVYLTVIKRDEPVDPPTKSDKNSGVSLIPNLSFFLLLLLG